MGIADPRPNAAGYTPAPESAVIKRLVHDLGFRNHPSNVGGMTAGYHHMNPYLGDWKKEAAVFLKDGFTENNPPDFNEGHNYMATKVAQGGPVVLETISSNRATVVEGETGSGKTTQVPQYVLEDAAQRGVPCNIVVAQPRRVSAMSVAERVASERGESIGGTVGYSIRLERKATSNTRLLFCTTGILLKRLEDDSLLTNVTHVFVDEVHERSLEGDFLLMVLRDLIPEREKLAKESAGRIPPLKIVLMSATLDASLFHDYFWGAPSVKFPGRTFPVTELYLEDAMEVTGHVVRGNEDWARKGGNNGGGGNAAKPGDGKSGKGRVPLKDDPRLAPLHERDDEYLNGRELAERYANYSPSVQNSLAKIDHNAINYSLVVETIAWLSKLPSPQSAAEYLNGKKKSRGSSKSQGDATGSGAGDSTDTTSSAILVFLPGIKEITTLQELLQQSPAFRNGQARDWVLPIHSTIPPEEQRLVFMRPPKGVRKVVLATNIAETAITIDDVAFVVDTGRMKENRYDPVKRMSSLEDCLVARSNARQRRGRAGRVRPGTAVHLFTRHRHDKIAAVAQDPEVQRVPLEQLVLRIKALKYPGTAAEVCARLVEPPSDASVQKAIDELKFLEAMTVDSNGVETMTPLGVHLSHLPVDCRIGKLILLGAMFGVTNDALTVAATLSYRSPFQSPISKREEADRAKMSFATAQSDHLSVVRAYNEVDSIKGHAKYDFCRENFLSIKTLQTIGGLKRQFLELLSAAGFVRPGLRSRGVESLGRRNGGNDGVALALEQGLGDRRFDGRGRGGGAKGGRTTQKAMPGDWECDVQACQARNFARNQRCFRCRADKPEKPYVYPEEEEKKEEDFLEDSGSDDDDDDLDSDDEEENTQPILKALLVAGLFPQMVMLETKEGKKGKGKSQPTLRGKPESNGEKPEDMALHPSSIAGKCLSSMSSKYLVYHERVKTTRVYIRDATPVSPYALLLFGGGSIRVEPCAAGSLESVMRLDGWLGFKCPRRDHMLVTELRGVLDGIMRNKIENPKSEFCANARGIIGAVKCILEMDEEGTAVQDRERHLTALDRLVKKSKGKSKGGGGGGGGKKKKAKGKKSRGSGSRGAGDNRGKKQSAAGRWGGRW
ncbi:hypothetical protein ACHAXT_001716 [Thalassiosira profunda]